MINTIQDREKLKFVDPRDPILEQVALPLTEAEMKDPTMQQFFDAMLRFARGEQTDQKKSLLVGLAAPQIGNSLRVILVDIKADGKGHVDDLCLYINPEILESSKEQELWYEGCYSAGAIKGIVSRAKYITISALDRYGHPIQEKHEGYVARIFQHEIDHLNGKRFPQLLESCKELHLVREEEMFLYRNEQGWRHWERRISQKDWKKHL